MTSDQLPAWIRGNIELAFWAKVRRIQGCNWPEDYRERLRKDRPLPEHPSG